MNAEREATELFIKCFRHDEQKDLLQAQINRAVSQFFVLTHPPHAVSDTSEGSYFLLRMLAGLYHTVDALEGQSREFEDMEKLEELQVAADWLRETQAERVALLRSIDEINRGLSVTA